MSTRVATILIIGGLTVACADNPNTAMRPESPAASKAQAASWSMALPLQRTGGIASLPDRGSLLAFQRDVAPVRRGATTWHPVQVSEAHALRAIAAGGMTLTRPGGAPLEVKYERHVEHPDGNWTFIGSTPGQEGGSTILTFGEKAVFGTIADAGGRALELSTAQGRTWMVETDPGMQTAAQQSESKVPDFLPAPITLASKAKKSASASRIAMAISPAASSHDSSVVDLAIGYTPGFASRLGGTSQAVTRLTHLVEIANQAYSDSQVAGRVRLVRTVQVDYSETTSNRQALFDLTGLSCTQSNAGDLRLPDAGMNCTAATTPASLQPLLEAREAYRADLVSLVRPFAAPEHGSCGTAWLLGAQQTQIDASSADFGFSVVSDTSGNQFPDDGQACREEYLAHELGHNMGLQHNRSVASRSNDTNGDGDQLDPEEYGVLPYTFGYVAGAEAGNFYTVMSLRVAGATGYRVFSNPRVTACGGNPCGVEDEADNARGLAITMPLVARFRASLFGGSRLNNDFSADFNGDNVADLLWRNSSDGRNSIWRSANGATLQAVAPIADQSWQVAGVGDFNGDSVADILWRNGTTGTNRIWSSGNYLTPQNVGAIPDLAWHVAGIGDFNGDGRSDILWRNRSSGQNGIWLSGNYATSQVVGTIADQAWQVAGVGDFNGDGKSDILWRNQNTGANRAWLSGNVATPLTVATIADQAWQVAGVGDFNNDNRSDILWRNSGSGQNGIWLSGNYATSLPVAAIADQAWQVASVGDYNNDGRSDLLWRNSSTGVNRIWLSANYATPHNVATVAIGGWNIVY